MNSPLHAAINRYLAAVHTRFTPEYDEAEHLAASRALDDLIASTERSARRWDKSGKVVQMDASGDVSVFVAVGSSENVEACCGPWPESVRDRLLRGEELDAAAEVNAVFDHAHQHWLTPNASLAVPALGGDRTHE